LEHDHEVVLRSATAGPSLNAVLSQLAAKGIQADGKSFVVSGYATLERILYCCDGRFSFGTSILIVLHVQASQTEVSAKKWVAQHAAQRPVIVLRHAVTAAQSKGEGRRLQEVAELTESEISQYQVRIPRLATYYVHPCYAVLFRIYFEHHPCWASDVLSDMPCAMEIFALLCTHDFHCCCHAQICLWTAVGFVLLLGASVCSVAQMEVIPDSLLYAKFQSGRTGGRTD
jgi:hypothetical protein